MARADLIIQLARNGLNNDKTATRKVIEAIIAEERAMQHNVLAEKLNGLLNTTHNDRSNDGMQIIDQRNGSLVHEIVPRKTLSDLILPKDILELCNEIIEEQHRKDLLRSYNIEPRHRILLIGPPGNGKTTLTEAIAEALIVPLFIVRYDSIVGTYLGETAVRLRKLFDYISTRKCVLFFDEFETLGKERGDTHETGEIKRVVSSLLLHIDNLPSHVVVVGATNHPELLDRAVWRRFQIRMVLPAPTKESLIKWFEKYQQSIKVSFGYSPTILADYLLGSSYSEVEEFGTTIFRQYILNQPKADIKKIISHNLRLLSAKSAKVKPIDETENKDG